MSGPKYPDIEVALTDEDGNVFMIMGRVRRALRKAGVGQAEIDEFSNEMCAGNYDDALQTVTRWVSVT